MTISHEIQELNEKLVRWLWGQENIEVHGTFIYRRTRYIQEDEEWDIELTPFFPHDMSACFKHLVPKFHAWTMGSCPDGDTCAVVVLKEGIRGEACANDPAIALCRATGRALSKEQQWTSNVKRGSYDSGGSSPANP